MLWEVPDERGTTACLMVSCCDGAELQVVRWSGAGDDQILLRELYPDRDSLYERARQLRTDTAARVSPAGSS